MGIVETNEHRSRVGVFLSENLPEEPRCRDILVFIEEDILLIVVNIAVLKDPMSPSVDSNFLAKTEGETFIEEPTMRNSEKFYLMESSRELYSKLFQFPLLKDWN